MFPELDYVSWCRREELLEPTPMTDAHLRKETPASERPSMQEDWDEYMPLSLANVVCTFLLLVVAVYVAYIVIHYSHNRCAEAPVRKGL
jgi:hypothetical protein